MKNLLCILAVSGLLAVSTAFAGGPNTYQVTGPVTAITDTVITVQKGTESWQIARTADTKVNGDLKVGSKVTITYTMTAATVDVKADKAPAKGTKASASASPK